MAMNFVRRKSDVDRYERAKKCLENIHFDTMRNKLMSDIEEFEVNSKIIEFIINHPKLTERMVDHSKDGKEYLLDVRLIARDYDDNHTIKECTIQVKKVGENYTDPRLNIGKDYHTFHVMNNTGAIDYWRGDYRKFLLEQLLNQDKLEQMCEELNVMAKSYFTL